MQNLTVILSAGEGSPLRSFSRYLAPKNRDRQVTAYVATATSAQWASERQIR
ncbi:hypothetical protein [Fodinibius salsisoli]|uniref:hypothetical protein n=1 Tax=Fodinibius salsisoli TaxID=2820877 RepID=UPI0022482A2E|nr:hypothetical protein [Fodinibius salsisoli]